MPTTTPGSDRVYRGRLDREVIISAALAFIDEHGAQGLTMRLLGGRLDVEAMSLYRYVTGREDLLEGVVGRLIGDLEQQVSPELGATWQGFLQDLAHRVRQMSVDHPLAFPLVATRHPAAPWLRPPLRSLSLVDHLLSTMRGHGFDDEQAVAIYRAFSSFLLGHLLLESTVRGALTSPVDQPIAETPASVEHRDQSLNLHDHPTLLELQGLLSEDHSAQEFEIALEALLDRLELTINQ